MMETQTRTEVLRRLKGIEGHVASITRMVEEDRDCFAVLQQLRAIHGALRQTSLLVMSHHLDHCLCELGSDVDDIARSQLRAELLTLFSRKE